MKGIHFSPVVSHLMIPFAAASESDVFVAPSPSFGSEVHAADFLTNPLFVKSSMTSKDFLLPTGETVGWEVVFLCFVRFGSGAIYRCEGCGRCAYDIMWKMCLKTTQWFQLDLYSWLIFFKIEFTSCH